MVSRKYKIHSETGLHLRPAGAISEAACRYQSRVFLIHDGTRSNAKSILNLLAAGVHFQDEIEICCEGPDEEEAMECIAGILERDLEARASAPLH